MRVGLADGHEQLATESEDDIEGRIAFNGRGISLRSELSSSSETTLRIGQCWRIGDKNLEILAFQGDLVEYMDWRCVKESGQGAILYVSPEGDYEGYPTGMGGRKTIDANAFRDSVLLVELRRD
jgi:hypothetical protein